MKINLEAGPSGENYREGYLNIFVDPKDPRILPCHWSNLDSLVKDDEAEEILGEFVLQKCPPSEIGNVLRHWRKKLSPAGVMKLCFFDARMVCRDGNNRIMNLENIHNALLGSDGSFRCVLDTVTVREVLEKLDFNIDMMTMENTLVTIEVTKLPDANGEPNVQN